MQNVSGHFLIHYMNSRVNKILIVLLSFTVLSIFFIPFCWIFFVGNGDDPGHWKKLYLVEDWVLLMFYLPFVILWTIYLMRTKTLNLGVFKFLLVVTAFITFAVSFLSGLMLSQDYETSWGMLLSLFIFPLLIALLINRNILLRQNETAANNAAILWAHQKPLENLAILLLHFGHVPTVVTTQKMTRWPFVI